jgi:hypothetical protein
MLKIDVRLTYCIDLKLGQYTKVPPRWTFCFQLAGSVIGSIFSKSLFTRFYAKFVLTTHAQTTLVINCTKRA